MNKFSNYNLFLAPVLLLIITSAFKFLSVTLVLDKFKQDTQVFFLLISSAFLLIITQILLDISSGLNLDQNFLPFALFPREIFNFQWASEVFENLEAFAFYGGVLIAFYLLFRSLLGKIKQRFSKQEESALEKIESIQENTSIESDGSGNSGANSDI